MQIRKAEKDDLLPLLQLYTHLHENPMPAIDDTLLGLWGRILDDPGHFILVGVAGGELVSSCVLLVVPNLTHGQRPYALIENVVTHSAHRRRGYAGAVLHHAKTVAQQHHCYKMMLMSGAKDAATLRFYEQAGYNRQDKTAFVQWLP